MQFPTLLPLIQCPSVTRNLPSRRATDTDLLRQAGVRTSLWPLADTAQLVADSPSPRLM